MRCKLVLRPAMISCIYILKITLTCVEHDINKMFSKNRLVTRKTKETKSKKQKKQTKRVNYGQWEIARKLKNCRILRKKGGTIDWQNKDEEAQSDSNRALCDIRTNSWRGIVKLPHNRESDC